MSTPADNNWSRGSKSCLVVDETPGKRRVGWPLQELQAGADSIQDNSKRTVDVRSVQHSNFDYSKSEESDDRIETAKAVRHKHVGCQGFAI